MAVEADIPALEVLIPLSVGTLQAPFYSREQMDAALGPVFGVDRQLIRDGTYFVVEENYEIIACGGWSKRKSLFGGDKHRSEPDAKLNPVTDAARVRAFFVHPNYARRGIGKALLRVCEDAIRLAGFSEIELVATLSGEPLYCACGYAVTARYEISLVSSLSLPVVAMKKSFNRGHNPVFGNKP